MRFGDLKSFVYLPTLSFRITSWLPPSTMLVEEIKKTGKSVHYTPTFDDCEKFLRENWQPGDLVITMSCGNIHLLNAQIQEHGDDYKM